MAPQAGGAKHAPVLVSDSSVVDSATCFGPVHFGHSMNDFLASDPHFPRYLALLFAFLLVVVWLRAQPEWLLVVLPIFALTFLGFDRLADGVTGLMASGEMTRLAMGAVLMAGPAFGVGFALGRRARRSVPAPVSSSAADQTVTGSPTEETAQIRRTFPDTHA